MAKVIGLEIKKCVGETNQKLTHVKNYCRLLSVKMYLESILSYKYNGPFSVNCTVEPLNRGHFGTAAFVLFSEVV